MTQIHSHLKFQQNYRTSPTENLHPTRKDLTRHKHGRPKISTRIILTSSNPTFESTSNSPFKISNSTRDDDRSDLPVSILSERDWQMEGSLSKSSNREGLHGQHHDTVFGARRDSVSASNAGETTVEEEIWTKEKITRP